jgi:hypothetical protein
LGWIDLVRNLDFWREIHIFGGKFSFLAGNLDFWREIQIFGGKF